MTHFSYKERAAIIEMLKHSTLDVLIIGGGITGSGILLDAQARGMKAALVEMHDFASGTSSRSTKLVHGGLRYLKQLEIGLVAEVGRERAIVYENGPHVTTPEWMLLPLIEGGTFGRLSSSVGIFAYDLLAGVKKQERRRMLNAEQTLAMEPLVRKNGLKGAGYYVEYRTDDARLTMEVLKEAVQRGGSALNYTQVECLLYEDGRVVGAQVQDKVTGQTYSIYARKVVNATGPWVDKVREMDGSKTGKTLHHTKGVHIVVDAQRFPLKNAVYFDVPDGRMIFAIPREGKTYIGTTDTNYQGELNHPTITCEDMRYLVNAVHFMFPSVELKESDVESSWAGVRPLIHEEGKNPSEISRKDEVFVSQSGLLSMAGGKLTGYRKMAEKVVNQIAKDLRVEDQRIFAGCNTDKIGISGGKFGGSQLFPEFVNQHIARGIALGLSEDEANRVVRRYGSNGTALFDIIQAEGDRAEEYGLSLEVFSALNYAIGEEMAMTPSDFFIRRTSSLYFNIAWVRQWKVPVVSYMAQVFGWSEEQRQKYEAELESALVAVLPM